MIMPVLLIHLILLLSVVESQPQTPHVTFLAENLRNLSYVDFSLVGNHANGDNGVQCHTHLLHCCSATEGKLRGDWFFPDGMKVRFNDNDGVYLARRAQRVDLRRSKVATRIGIYCCTIPYDADDTSLKAILCVRLGYAKLLEDMRFTIDSNLNRGSPQFTLTCISTAELASTVTWTRDSATVTEGTETDTVTPQFTHTLTVTRRLPGLYSCTLQSNKQFIDSRTFTIHGASAPSNLALIVIQIDSTSILLTWTPPNPLGDTTGYRISFTGGSSGSVNVSGGSTDNFTLTRLRSGEMYNISIVGTSEHFFSESVPWDPVMLPGSGGGSGRGEQESGKNDLEKTTGIVAGGSGGGGEDEESGKKENNDLEKTTGIVAGISVPLVLLFTSMLLLLCWKWNHLKASLQSMRSSTTTSDTVVSSESPSSSEAVEEAIYNEICVVKEIKSSKGINVAYNEAYGPILRDNVPTTPKTAYRKITHGALKT